MRTHVRSSLLSMTSVNISLLISLTWYNRELKEIREEICGKISLPFLTMNYIRQNSLHLLWVNRWIYIYYKAKRWVIHKQIT